MHTPHSAAAKVPPSARLAIIGAGPVGLALGLLMARRCPQWSVSLYDARALQSDVGSDPRTLALSLGSIQLLRQLQAWPPSASQAIMEVRVSQEAAALAAFEPRPQVSIRASELGVEALGAVLSYGALVPALQKQWEAEVLAQPDRLHHRFGHPVAGLKIVDGPCGPAGAAQVEVDCANAERFDLVVVAEGGVFMRGAAKAELVVDSARHNATATAAQGRIKAWMDRALTHDYGQTAWVGTVGLTGAQAGVAIERFTRQGPVALLPLPAAQDPTLAQADTLAGVQRASLVWCVNAQDDPVPALDDAQRIALLNSLLPADCGRIERISPLKSFALGLQAQTTLVRDGCLVRIGNAAQTLHPVAGQGLNLGLRDAYALVEQLQHTGRKGRAWTQALQRVQWSRAADRWSMIAATDFLARSFTWSLPGAASARALGLMAVERLPGLKPLLARRMMFGQR